jgi:hypothetical protein
MRKWRFLLPALQGFVAIALMIWEQYNERVITSMGMAWDTGAPMWPFQTPEILLAIFNAPAYIFAIPIADLLRLRTLGERQPVLLLAILLLWFYVGWLIDFRSVSWSWISRRKWLTAALAVATMISLSIGAHFAVDGVRWFGKYDGVSFSSLFVFARAVWPAPWCVVIVLVSSWAIFRMLRSTWRRRLIA